MELIALEHMRQSQVDLAGQIYQAYPRKVARGAAIKAILQALKKVPGMTLMERTKAYAEAKRNADHQFIPHPATWFNQERWDDDPAEWRVGDSLRSAAQKELERVQRAIDTITGNYQGLQTPTPDDRDKLRVLVAKKKELRGRLGL